jgi:hypothetical protein
MFNSDKLMEKWGPLLNAESCDPIKDSHRKAVTAVLCSKTKSVSCVSSLPSSKVEC